MAPRCWTWAAAPASWRSTAGLLGAGQLRAIDTDPVAVESTLENARRNGVAIVATTGSLPVDGSPVDLLLANLVASLLVDSRSGAGGGAPAR